MHAKGMSTRDIEDHLRDISDRILGRDRVQGPQGQPRDQQVSILRPGDQSLEARGVHIHHKPQQS